MKEIRLAELIGEVREDFVEQAQPPVRKKRMWNTVLALAACLTLVIAIGAVSPFFQRKGSADQAAPMASPTVEESVPESPEEMAPHIEVDGKRYYISSHLSSYEECPGTFAAAGVLETGEFAGCSYYTSEEYPHLIYVYTMTNNRGELDSSGTVIPTEPHMAYLRFVAKEMRGKDFVCVDGQLYTSMWNGWGTVNREFYDQIEAEYGARMEGEAPEGFASVGTAEFVGWDLWPEGALSSNTGEEEIYTNPDHPDVVLVAATWHTVQGEHRGFHVYLRYEREPIGN